MREHPSLFDFVINAYYDETAPAMGYIENLYATMLKKSTELMLNQIDRRKFRDEQDVELLLAMVFWMADGFMLRQQRTGAVHDLDAISAQFGSAMRTLRKAYYKEEYQ